MVMVNGTRDEWFKQFANPTKSVFQFLSMYKAL